MKKQIRRLLALAAVLGLGGFATANANVSGDIEPRSSVIHWATVVFCDQDGDGRAEQHEVCVGGHTGGFAGRLIDGTVSAVPGGVVAAAFLGL